jgi:hypothetical protein
VIPVSDALVGLPVGLLGVGVVVLLAAMVMMSTSLPSVRWRLWRRQRRVAPTPRRNRRRVVTGRPPSLSRSNGPPRQTAATPDVPDAMIDARGAEQVIQQYLDRDPRALATVISSWLAADDPKSTGVSR